MKTLQHAIRRNWRGLWSFLAPAIDIIIAFISYLLTALLWGHTAPYVSVLASNWRFATLTLFLFLGFSLGRGLYRKFAFTSLRRQFFHAGWSFLHAVAVVFAVYFLKQYMYYPREFIIIFYLVLPPLYVAIWLAIRALMAVMGKRGYGRWKTMLIGPEEDLGKLVRRIESHPELGYDVKEVLRLVSKPGVHDLMHVDAGEVGRSIDAHEIELIIFSSARLDGSFDGLLKTCQQHGTAVRLVSVESDFLFSRAGLKDFAGIPLSSPGQLRIERIRRTVKRTTDFFGASLMLILLSPVFVVLAILIKLESEGPVFFRQKRALSDKDKPFDFLKLRTMHNLADCQKSGMFQADQWNGALFKVKDDPRLTKVGRLLRRHSIDELPQLFNVFKGEMSLVGPRPLPIGDFAHIQDRDFMGGYFRQRARAKPGMTGLWQISGRSDLGFREMVLLDLYYIENQSVILDLEILIRTIPAVTFGKGAY
jgi:exopolysaccharide biosynthesis polyprenyl glycosylphosphotransferase